MEVKKILMADDDKDFLEELTTILQASGYETIALSQGAEVLRVAQQEKPDVILLDLNMEDESGFKIADQLKRLPAFRAVPLIAITGIYTETEYKLLMKMVGFRECLVKPVNPLDLISSIEQIEHGSLKVEKGW